MPLDPRTQQRLSIRAQSLGHATERIHGLLDQFAAQANQASLREAALVACRALQELSQENSLDAILRYLEEISNANADEAREVVLDAAKLEEFLGAERRLLVQLGINPQTAQALVDECRRVGPRALQPPSPNQLRVALEGLRDEVCRGDQELRERHGRWRLIRRMGGWTMMLGNGAIGAAAVAGVPFTFGVSITVGAGAAASAGYGAHLATSDE